MNHTGPKILGTLMAVLLLAIMSAIPASAQCSICARANTEVSLTCASTTDDGYAQCVDNSEYCAGVLPRCYGSGRMAADGIIRRSTGRIVTESPVELSMPKDDVDSRDEKAFVRRSCDGAVMERRYSAEAAATLRRVSQRLTV